jgi:hypothetical protein
MEQSEIHNVEETVRAAFPENSLERVEVLQYGDDPVIERGQIGIRVFVDQAPRPEVEKGGETLKQFYWANRKAVNKLRHELTDFAMLEFRFGGEAPGALHGPRFRSRFVDGRGRLHRAPDAGAEVEPADEVLWELIPVTTRLGPADLATVDMLITAGIANSRAEVLRWAVARIREHPAYAQLQQRVSEISDLRAQF